MVKVSVKGIDEVKTNCFVCGTGPVRGKSTLPPFKSIILELEDQKNADLVANMFRKVGSFSTRCWSTRVDRAQIFIGACPDHERQLGILNSKLQQGSITPSIIDVSKSYHE